MSKSIYLLANPLYFTYQLIFIARLENIAIFYIFSYITSHYHNLLYFIDSLATTLYKLINFYLKIIHSLTYNVFYMIFDVRFSNI